MLAKKLVLTPLVDSSDEPLLGGSEGMGCGLLETAVAAAANNLMTQVNNWFVESSYGKIYLLTTVAPLIELPHGEMWYHDPGDEYELRSDASAAAKAMGYDVDLYDHVVLAYAGGPGNFLGLAAIGEPHALGVPFERLAGEAVCDVRNEDCFGQGA